MLSSLNLRSHETRPVIFLFFYSFFTGASVIFSYTIAFSLFLSEFEESSFAYVFIVAAILSLGIGSWFTRLEQLVSTKRLFRTTISILLFTSIIFQIGVWLEAGSWIFWGLLVWYRLYYMLINLSFWGVAGRVFDVQQGKRLFGFVATGEDIAKIVGYGTVPLVVTLVGLNNTLVINSLMLLGMLILFNMLAPHITEAKATGEGSQLAGYSLSDLLGLFIELFNERYIRNIFILTFVGVLSYFVIDYGFYSVVRQQFTTSTELAQFIGYFWMAVYIFSLIIRIFVTNALLRRWGLYAGLIFLPVTFAVVSTFFSGATVFAAGSLAVFIGIGLIKFFEDSLSITVNRSATTLLYQPLPAKTTLSAQVVAEALVAPVGLGVAGVLILLFNNLSFFGLMWLSFVMLILAGIRFLSSQNVFRGYVETLNRALSARRLQGSLDDLGDSASLDVLEGYFESDDPATVVYVLDLMEQVAPDRLIPQLPMLLSHSNATVARTAVRSVGRLKVRSALPIVREIVAKQNPVSSEALYTSLALDNDSATELALPYLENENPDLVKHAILGIVQFSDFEHKGTAAKKLARLSESEDVKDREMAAEICGRLEGDEIEEILDGLMVDPSPSVQKQAIQGLIKRPEVYGVGANLKKYENNHDLFEMIIQSLKHADGLSVIEDLLRYFEHPMPNIRLSVYQALNAQGYIVLSQDGRDAVENGIDQELELAAWVSAGLADLSKESEGGLLQRALEDMILDIRQRLFLLLSFVYDSSVLDRIADDLTKEDSGRQKALVLEAMSNLLSPKHWEKVSPIMQESDSKEIWRRLRRKSNQDRMDYLERIEAIIMTPAVADMQTSDWLRVTAMYDLGVQGRTELKDVLAFCAVHDNLMIRETAEWALASIDG